MNTVVAPVSLLNYLQTWAKAFARDSGVNDIDLGSHLGSGLDRTISFWGKRIPGPSEIDETILPNVNVAED
jgi:hypothetical protein